MEFTEQQRLYLATVCDYFHANGEWPTYGFLDHALDEREDLDVLQIGQQLATFMNEGWGAPLSAWDAARQARLSVPALHECVANDICPQVAEDLAAFTAVILVFIEKYRSGEENARVTEAELQDRLRMENLMLRKMFLLVGATSLSGGGGSNVAGPDGTIDWYITVSAFTRNFRRVRTLDDYLAELEKLKTPAASANPAMLLQLRHGYSTPVGQAEPDETTASVGAPQVPVADGDFLVPMSLIENTRDYIAIVASQVNKTYEVGCYDACAVMIRRLIETLIVEVYEARTIETQIMDPSTGDYFALSTLIRKANAEASLHLSRNTKKALRDLKDVGDLSAHNRRFNAVRDDIDKLSLDVRVAVQELVHLMKP